MKRHVVHHSWLGLLLSGLVAAMLAICGIVPAAFATTGGALDPTYGTSGLFVGGNGRGAAAVLDASGDLIIAGFAPNATSTYDDFALVRILPNGALDTSFGTSGIVKTDFGQEATGQAVAIDGLGRIVVAGTVGTNGISGNFAVARYNSNGTIDTTFNSTGMITTDFGHNNDSANGVAIDSSNRIIVVGDAYNGSSFDFALARYGDTGLDSTFGNSGTVLTDFNSRNDQANAVTIDGNGEIVVVGYSYDNVSQEFALARYNPSDGSLDSSFGTAGEVLTSFSGNARANAVAIDSSGNVIAAGVAVGSTNDFALARYTSTGVLDSSFNTTGMVTTDFGGNETAHSVTIDATGLIVAAGAFIDGSGNTLFALARYNVDGSIDSNFGTSGKVTTSFGGAHATATSVEMDSLQRIVVAGADTSNAFIAARYLSASANLGITNAASSSVPAGQPLAYMITVSNAGPDSTPAEVTDPLPAGVTYVSSSSSQGTCSFSNSVVSCALGTLANSATATVTINVTTTTDFPSVTNTATVAGNDPDPSNNSAPATTTITASADVSVVDTGPGTASAGGNIIYHIVVTNNGPSTADGVTLNDQVNGSFVDAIASQGASCVFSGSRKSGTLNCAIGTLVPSASANVTVTVAASHKRGTTTNTASVTATTFDPDTTNNSSTATVTIQ